MIEKMTFVTLAGPKTQIDYLVEHYLSKHDIHLENAIMEVDSPENYSSFSDENPFKSLLNRSNTLTSMLSKKSKVTIADISVSKAQSIIESVEGKITEAENEVSALDKQRGKLEEDHNLLSHFSNLDYTLDGIRKMTYIKYSFGRLPLSEFDRFESYLDPDLNEIFIECRREGDLLYGVFFAPDDYYEDIERDFKNLRFETIDIPAEYKDYPEKEMELIQSKMDALTSKAEEKRSEVNNIVSENESDILSAAKRIERAYSNFDVRRLAICTRDGDSSFQILCGWMTGKDAIKLQKETDSDPNVMCILSDDEDNHRSSPPTKLKNPKLVRPFEMFVKMYGLPAYKEFDPTIFLAITYSVIFGMMFGDLGQGLVLLIAGFIFYKVKKADLGGIIMSAGLFSCIFGALFGSFFGFEFESVLNPLHSKIPLPFLGETNTVLVAAFIFGSFLILATMILNITKAIKNKDVGKALFGPNSVTGFIFYGSIILIIFLFMNGKKLPATILLILMLVVPLILMFLEVPLRNLISKKKPLIDESPGIFGATAFFELFDYLLTYLSNALSFLRVGVFAISHAAMMQVVMSLAGAENGGASIPVVIIGNLIVIVMEGLIVGIQVLRLEYYEMFGRFYEGTGREFVPYGKEHRD